MALKTIRIVAGGIVLSIIFLSGIMTIPIRVIEPDPVETSATIKLSCEPCRPDASSEPIPNIEYEQTFLYQEEQEEAARQAAEEARLAEEQRKAELTKIVEKVIYVEARGESLEGKIAVGATIINRLASEGFPDDINDVLKAYAPIGKVTEAKLATVPECRVAAERAVAGEDPLEQYLGGPTYYFYNPELSDLDEVEKRKDIKVTIILGNHVFYSEWE